MVLFHHCCDIFCDDLMERLEHFYQTGSLRREYFIMLTPKNNEVNDLKDFISIGLVENI